MQHHKPWVNYLFFAAFFLVATRLSAQDKYIQYQDALRQLKLKEYSIITKGDTIRFLATLPGKKKKTIVFVAGSGPVPLITMVPEGYYPPFPFELDTATRAEFNLV